MIRPRRPLAIRVVQDRDRRRRFESEARAASALEHPNVLVVHDIYGSPSALAGPRLSHEAEAPIRVQCASAEP